MEYRKKPVVIEAFKWTPDEWVGEDPEWLVELEERDLVSPMYSPAKDEVVLRIATLEGIMVANPGDYVIIGVEGEVYPCKPRIFEATYERVEEEDEYRED